MRKKLEIRKLDRYNKLRILNEIENYLEKSGKKIRQFKCICDCGNTKNNILINGIGLLEYCKKNNLKYSTGYYRYKHNLI